MGDDKPTDYQFKVLLIGNVGVGKTSLILRFTENTFSETTDGTLNVDLKTRVLKMSGKSVKMQVWDTAGQERFRTITSSYYRGAQGIIVVYDSTERETFECAPRLWIKELEEYAVADCSKLLVATKTDLTDKRKVTKEEGKELAEDLNIDYLEIFAKIGEGVMEAFNIIAKDMIEAQGGHVELPTNPSLSIPKARKKRCLI